MKRILFSLLAVAAALPVLAAAKAPVASALLSPKEAVALAGGPLGEITRFEVKPGVENGHDHNTICGYFPKGYKLAEAERPPERGIQLSLHTFRSRGEAQQFYNLTRDTEQETAKATPGAKVAPLKGVGEAGVLSTRGIPLVPKAVCQVANAYFLKGSTMAQVTVWKRDAPATGIATTAAKQVAAKLP